jgi:hypothetical protein
MTLKSTAVGLVWLASCAAAMASWSPSMPAEQIRQEVARLAAAGQDVASRPMFAALLGTQPTAVRLAELAVVFQQDDNALRQLFEQAITLPSLGSAAQVAAVLERATGIRGLSQVLLAGDGFYVVNFQSFNVATTNRSLVGSGGVGAGRPISVK